MKRINNMAQLQRAMQPVLREMVDEMSDLVYQTLNYFLQTYYDSYDPLRYQRTKAFLFSAVKVEAKKYGNGYKAIVYIDAGALDNYNVSGYQVVEWANKGLHGGLDVGNGTPRVWDDTIENTVDNGELLKAAREYLKQKGFNVVQR